MGLLELGLAQPRVEAAQQRVQVARPRVEAARPPGRLPEAAARPQGARQPEERPEAAARRDHRRLEEQPEEVEWWPLRGRRPKHPPLTHPLEEKARPAVPVRPVGLARQEVLDRSVVPEQLLAAEEPAAHQEQAGAPAAQRE